MAEETLANVEEAQEPENTEPEVDYKAELEKFRAESEQDKKNLQRNLSDREAKLKVEQERNSKIDEQFGRVGQELAWTRDYIQHLASQTNSQNNDIDPYNPSPKPANVQVPTPSYDKYVQEQAQLRAVNEVKDEMSDLGLDPEADWNEVAGSANSPTEAVRKARKLAEKRKVEMEQSEAAKAEKEKKEKEETEEAEQKIAASGESGALTQPKRAAAGGSGVRIPRRRAEFDQFVNGLSSTEYESLKPEIDRLWYSGEIK